MGDNKKKKGDTHLLEIVKKYNELRVPARASLWYIGSGGFARAIGALSTPIFTRLLSPAEYGLFPLYNSWMSVISVLVTLELGGSVLYRAYQKYADKKDELTSSALGLIGAIFISFSTLYFAFYGLIGKYTGLSVRVSIFMLAEIFASAVLSVYIARARFEYKYRAVALLNTLSAILAPFTALSLIFLTEVRAEARIYSSSIVAVLIALPIACIVINRSERLFAGEMWRYLLARSLPLLPHYFASALILKSIEIGIGRSHGSDALARYSIAVSVGMILTIVTGGLLSALSPWIIRKIKEGDTERVRDFLLLVTKALSLVALLILAGAPEVTAFLAAEDFRQALPSVYPLEIGVILSFLAGALMSGCAYYERSFISSIPALVSGLVSLTLSLFLLPRMDYRFAGILPLCSYIILAVLTALLFKRMSGEYPIALGRCLGVIALALGYATLLYLFKDVLISRIFLALPLLPLLFIEAKGIYARVRE